MINPKSRRSEFDWLRVIAFGILIFFHTGMLFVPWDWHIKNNELSNSIEWPMFFISQWRMSLIFLVSGVSVYYALGQRSTGVFLSDRLKRILLPFIAGVFLLVAPQVYFERLTQGYDKNYLEFYLSSFLNFKPYPEGDFSWHHLWFLLYILVYCVLLAPLLVWIKKSRFDPGHIAGGLIFLLPLCWFGVGEHLLSPLFPKTGALYNDWFSHFIYVSMFLVGFFVASSATLQRDLKASRLFTLIAGITTSVLIYLFFWKSKSGWEYTHPASYYLLASHRWFWILAIVGFALAYLSKPSPRITNINQHVYPFYILHQTVIVLLGYYLNGIPWSIFTKFCVISLVTIGICFLVIRYVIMRVNFLRITFGMTPIRK